MTPQELLQPICRSILLNANAPLQFPLLCPCHQYHGGGGGGGWVVVVEVVEVVGVVGVVGVVVVQ